MHITKFHQYIKPRYTNPTYNSNRVGTSLGSFYATDGTYLPKVKQQPYSPPKYQFIPQSNPQRHQLYQNYGNPQNMPEPRSNPKYEQNIQPATHRERQAPPPNYQNYNQRKQERIVQQRQPQHYDDYNRKKIDSRFSRFGTQSLVMPNISDRQIYEKQNKHYNIISIKPNQYPETIRKYPKLHLQDQDVNFYKRMELESQYKQMHQMYQNDRRQQRVNQHMSNYNKNPNDRIAGKHTDFSPKDLHPHFLKD